MRSLWLKLLAAFALVILLGAAVDALLVSRATSGQFNRFVIASSQGWTQQMAPVLADHYARTGSWTGVEPYLRSPWLGMMGMAQAEPSRQGQNGGQRGTQSEVLGADMIVVTQTAPSGQGQNWSQPGMYDGMMGSDMMGWDMTDRDMMGMTQMASSSQRP